MNWSDLESHLAEGWRAIGGKGSLADAPLESGMDSYTAIEWLSPIERIASEATQTWLRTGQWPILPPAAMRLAEFRMYFALDLCRELNSLPGCRIPPDWDRHQAIQWLLSVYHSAAQPAVDNTLGDILGGGSGHPQENNLDSED